MELIDIITQGGGGRSLEAVAREFGLSTQQTKAAVEELAPVVAAGLRRNTGQPDGLVALLQALSAGNHQAYVDDLPAIPLPDVAADGNGILAHAFGSKDVSREVAMRAAGSTGIGGALLKKLLPVIAAMVLGGLAKKMSGGATPAPAPRGGGLGDIIGDILGGGRRGAPTPPPGPPPGGGLDDLLRDILGGGAGRPGNPGGAPMPDAGGGDNPFETPGSRPRRGGMPRQGYNEEAIGRSRDSIDDALGRGTGRGNAADDLLNSVERHLRGM